MKRSQCTAKSKTSGKRCAQTAIPGGTVCRYHGGAAPQVQRAAKERIAALVDPMLTLVERDTMSKLQASLKAKGRLVLDKVDYLFIKDILDRAGYKPKIEVEHSGLVEHIITRLQAARKRTDPGATDPPAPSDTH